MAQSAAFYSALGFRERQARQVGVNHDSVQRVTHHASRDGHAPFLSLGWLTSKRRAITKVEHRLFRPRSRLVNHRSTMADRTGPVQV
jgi:hypothetical protein